MILTGLRIELWKNKPKVGGKIEKNPKNWSKIAQKSLFFPLFRKKSFLNRTLGLRKSFLNQTTYVLKNRLYQQSFLNRDSFLNRAFLNRDSTVHKIIPTFAFWENRGHHKFLSRLRQSFWSEKLSSWWCRFNDAWIQRDTSLFSNFVFKINWGHKERHLIFVLKWVYFIVCSILRTYFVSKSVNIAATCIVCSKLFFCKQLSLMVNC